MNKKEEELMPSDKNGKEKFPAWFANWKLLEGLISKNHGKAHREKL